MHPITNYIQERIDRIKNLENEVSVSDDWGNIKDACISELQAVLSKIEELGEKESEESRLEALNLKRLMERDYPQELNK